MTVIPTVTPRIKLRVDLTEWSQREPLRTVTGTIDRLTEHTITVLVEPDGSHRSYFLEDVTLHQPYDERQP